MESHKNANLLMIGAAAAVVLIVVGAYYYYTNVSTPEESAVQSTDISVAAEVSSAAQTPADKLPETNPFKTETNPFKEYKNPFE